MRLGQSPTVMDVAVRIYASFIASHVVLLHPYQTLIHRNSVKSSTLYLKMIYRLYFIATNSFSFTVSSKLVWL